MDATDSSPLVLIVDDDPDGRNLYSYALQAAGFRVEEAADGFEAVDKGYKLKPQVILMDLLMPRLDGWEVVSWLKKNPTTREIPIVAVTGAQEDIQQMAVAAGCRAVLTKPCPSGRVVDEVRQVLAAR
ncbi:MAG TPA: response regulator [Vicinamibacterales bacterium]|nr:response regulator [Acidobacteriota bacterium]HOC17373.1 response regulator [Vicinamibacterales bacterium]